GGLTLDAAAKILFLGKNFEKDTNDYSTKQGYIGEVQGHRDLRLRARRVNVDVFHPSNLQAKKDLNPKFYFHLIAKRLAHSFGLKGMELGFDLEGFNEAYSIPMLASILKHFRPSKEFGQEDMEWVAERLKNALMGEETSKESFEEVSKQIRKS